MLKSLKQVKTVYVLWVALLISAGLNLFQSFHYEAQTQQLFTDVVSLDGALGECSKMGMELVNRLSQCDQAFVGQQIQLHFCAQRLQDLGVFDVE